MWWSAHVTRVVQHLLLELTLVKGGTTFCPTVRRLVSGRVLFLNGRQGSHFDGSPVRFYMRDLERVRGIPYVIQLVPNALPNVRMRPSTISAPTLALCQSLHDGLVVNVYVSRWEMWRSAISSAHISALLMVR